MVKLAERLKGGRYLGTFMNVEVVGCFWKFG